MPNLKVILIIFPLLVLLSSFAYPFKEVFAHHNDFTVFVNNNEDISWSIITEGPCSPGWFCTIYPFSTLPGLTWTQRWGDGSLGESGSADFIWNNAGPVGTYTIDHGVACANNVQPPIDCTTDVLTTTIIVGRPPVADAGDDQFVRHRMTVTLDGTASFDPDGNSLTFTWTQISGPSVALSDIHSRTPIFVAPNVNSETEIVFRLVVDDGTYDRNSGSAIATGSDNTSDTVRVVIAANNRPVADAGSDQTVDEGTLVTLSAAGSSDADEDPLSYRWTQVSGSPTVQLLGSTTSSPQFTAPAVDSDTTFTFQLIVNDGIADSNPDTVNVIVRPKITLEVNADPTELNPYPPGVNIYVGGNPPPPQSEILVTARHASDNSPARGFNIKVEVCTQVGRAPTNIIAPDADGHIHDTRSAMCDRTDRPLPTIQVGDRIENPMTLTTDNDGKITLVYTPGQVIGPNNTIYYVSEEDTIIAQWDEDPTVESRISLITRVPNLIPVPGSENCGPGSVVGNYFFDQQSAHGCLFYGSHETLGALMDLATVYEEYQSECMNNTDHTCEIRIGRGPDDPIIAVTIDRIIPLGIDSMSLPWGGLTDSNGDWKPPLQLNANGRDVNLNWKDPEGVTIDDDHKVLLWAIILSDDRWTMPISGQGGNFGETYWSFNPDVIDKSPLHLELGEWG